MPAWYAASTVAVATASPSGPGSSPIGEPPSPKRGGRNRIVVPGARKRLGAVISTRIAVLRRPRTSRAAPEPSAPRGVQGSHLRRVERAVEQVDLVNGPVEVVHLVAAELGPTDHGVPGRGRVQAAGVLGGGKFAVDIEPQLPLRGIPYAGQVVPLTRDRLRRRECALPREAHREPLVRAGVLQEERTVAVAVLAHHGLERPVGLVQPHPGGCGVVATGVEQLGIGVDELPGSVQCNAFSILARGKDSTVPQRCVVVAYGIFRGTVEWVEMDAVGTWCARRRGRTGPAGAVRAGDDRLVHG